MQNAPNLLMMQAKNVVQIDHKNKIYNSEKLLYRC